MTKNISKTLLSQSKHMDKEKKYWQEKLAGDIVKTNFPYDKFIQKAYKRAQYRFHIDDNLFARLIQLSRGSDYNLYIVLLAGFTILLNKYTGNDDIIVGVPIYKQVTDADFMNTALAIRNRISGELTVKELIMMCKTNLFEANEHLNYPLERLLSEIGDSNDDNSNGNDRDEGKTLLDTSLLLENLHHKKYIEPLKPNIILSFLKNDTQLDGELEYNAHLYQEETVKKIAERLIRLLGIALDNVNLRVSEIQVTTGEEKEKLLNAFNETDAEYPKEMTIHRMFERQAEKRGDKIAIIGEGSPDPITYKQLNEKSNQLARHLREKGVTAGSIVAIEAAPSVQQIIGIMAVLKAGAAYMPIDPEFPAERVRYMLKDSRAKIILTHAETLEQAAQSTQTEEDPEHDYQLIDIDGHELAGRDTSNPKAVSTPSDIVYTIYTSGTSGRPKGVMLINENLVNYVTWFTDKIGLQESDRALLISSFAFDLGYTAVYPSLLAGGRLHIMRKEGYLSPGILSDYIRKEGITYLKLTPSLFSVIVNSPSFSKETAASLRQVVLGGEAINTMDVERARRLCEHLRIMNHYGPTEATIGCIATDIDFDQIDAYRDKPYIGKPIANTQVYVLDKNRQLLPVGIAGELYLAGKGIARGYLNQPELTAEKFVTATTFPIPSTPLYRTGDKARWMPDGNIEFLGRIDSQIKIRGYRIELKEIENQLIVHDKIENIAVTARQGKNGSKYICAYFVSTMKLETAELKNYLENRLPNYMVPAYFVELDKIPVTANGKLNRRALPEPEVGSDHTYISPRNHLQKELAELWENVLGIDEKNISIDANFFELGGDSLKATTLIAKTHKEFNAQVPLVDFFKAPTIIGLSEIIEQSVEEEYAYIEPAEEKEYYPPSSVQRRLYLVTRMGNDRTSYNLPQVLQMEGDIDLPRFRNAFKKLIHRHESLRTSFHMIDEKLVQRIHKDIDIELRYRDGTKGEQDLKEMLQQVVQPFDLSKAPLVRAGLIKTGKKTHIFWVDMHHIIRDGTSERILSNEFLTQYVGEELPPLRLHYKDYSEWMNGPEMQEKLKRQEKYWLEEFENEVPVLNLPTDYPRPATQSIEGDYVAFQVDKQQTGALNKIAHSESTTLFMALFSVFNLLMAKLSRQEDIAVGTPIAARPHNDLEKIIGMFINMLVIRFNASPELSYTDFLREIRKKTLAAYDNQEYPFEELVEKVARQRDLSRNPMFDVVFAMQNFTEEREASILKKEKNLEIGFYPYENKTSKFDITLFASEKNQQLHFSLRYCADLFKRETIERFVDYFKAVITSLIEAPHQKISDIELMSRKEKKQVLDDFNRTDTNYPKEKTIHRMFEDRVEQNPDNEAIKGNGAPSPLQYRRLNEKSNQLARRLRQKGIKPGAIVALMAEPTAATQVAIMAVLKAGGAYLPIDPEFPRNRVEYMLQDSRAKLILTQNHNMDFPGAPGEPIDLEDETIYAGDASNLEPLSTPEDIVYTVYTSGTTGKPKGVLLKNENLVNYISWFTGIGRISDSDRSMLISSFAFDLGYTAVYSTLLAGGQLHMAHKEMYLSPPVLLDYMRENGITYIKLTPSLFSVMVNSPGFTAETQGALRLVVLGGEPINTTDVEEAHRRCPHMEIMNHYGPTESTIGSIARFIDFSTFEEYKQKPTIGKPIDNTQVYILDENLKPVPPGVAAELYIGGNGVAAGYLNQPELTQEKFDRDLTHIKNSRENKTAVRAYKTGDMAKWTPDGNIEFLGRVDSQVKIRGFRIELEDIEKQLLKYENVQSAVVAAKEDINGNNYLCGYYVSESQVEQVDKTQLREYLSKNLPYYMVPPFFIQLDRIPVTPNGKLDHRALPEPEFGGDADYVPPRNELQWKLAELWTEVLGIDKDNISIDANFFEMGGDSLKTTTLIAKIHKECNAQVPLNELFKSPTIMGLHDYIEQTEKHDYNAIEPVEEKEYYPLSSAQRRLYVLQEMEENITSYNLPHVMALEGDIDLPRFKNAFKKLIDRHESLRTSFELYEDEPIQRIRREVEFDIDYYDAHTGAQDSREAMENFVRPFDLAKAPLVRVGIIKTAESRYILGVDMHHIVRDGTSEVILRNEFLSNYAGEEQAPLRLHYKDYTEWMNKPAIKEKLRRQEQYWLRQFTDEIPILNLPTDNPRPARQSFEGKTINFEITEEQTAALQDMARTGGTTQFMVQLSLFNVLLAKLSGQEDIIVGIPIAARTHADLEKVIGMFVNTLVLRNQTTQTQPFTGYLDSVRENTIEAFDNQDYPFEELVEKVTIERDLSRNPLFDVMFILQNITEDPANISPRKIENIKVGPYPHENKTAKFDLTLIAVEGTDKMHFQFQYCAKLFKQETIERLIAYYKNLTASVTQKPAQRIYDIDIMTPEEKKQVVEDFNRTGMEYENPDTTTLHHLFMQQAARTPEKTAIVMADQGDRSDTVTNVTYGRLDDKSTQQAHILKENGLKDGTIVSLMLPRSVEMMEAILAVSKAGGAYLPLDPGYPVERLKHIREDSNTSIMITQTQYLDQVRKAGFKGKIIDICKYKEDGKIPEHHRQQLQSSAKGNSPLYVEYTSGSTGKPKGIVIRHKNVVNFIHAMKKSIDFSPENVILALTTIAFDIFVLETLVPLTAGLKIVMADEEMQKDPERIKTAIRENNIDMLQVTPSTLKMLLYNQEDHEFLETVKQLMVGGEKFPENVFVEMKNIYGGKLYNMYGPTETTVWSTMKELDNDQKITIGKPIANTQVYVVDRWNRPQPLGVPGELLIGGDGVAAGYLNKPELTAEKFIKIPSSLINNKSLKRTGQTASHPTGNQCPMHNRRLYRTGDLARRHPDGNIEFLGRVDHQVKIRGFRIELGEIEKRLLNKEGIKEALVTVREEQAGEKYICAYIIRPEEKEKETAMELRQYLSQYLPDYMIPAYYVELEAFPLTQNGKIDRKRLPDPSEHSLNDGAAYAPPETEIEKKLVKIWESVLRKTNIGINENFFMIGGDSIKLIQIISRMRKAGYKMEMKDMFRTPTINRLAPQVTRATRTADQSTITGAVPLTPIQKYFFESTPVDPHHFNQSVVLNIKEGIRREALEAIFKKLQEHHDALRMTFNSEGNEIIQTNNGLEYPLEIREINNRKDEYTPEAQETICNEIQSTIDLQNGPLMKLGLFHQQTGARILLVIHHLVVDGISWRILLEDIDALYRQHKEGKTMELPQKTDSFKLWSEKQKEYADSETFLKEKSYWEALESREVPQLEKDVTPVETENHVKDTENLSVGLSEEETNRLLTKVNEAYGTEISDILLTGLGLGLKKTFGHDRYRIALEGHGREELFKDVDISRTVGWFTSIYPVTLEVTYEANPGRQVKEIKENLRRIPNKGVGYGILKYLTTEEQKKNMRFNASPQISFNYLGQFDEDAGQHTFEISKEAAGKVKSMNAKRNFELDVAAAVANNRLGLRITYNKKQYEAETVKRLIDNVKTALKQLIEHCTAKEEREQTPSDFTYKMLPIETVERLVQQHTPHKIEDIYTLSPMQEGMLFYALLDRTSAAYFEQMSFRLHGKLEIDNVQLSLNELSRRHDILRTAFIHENQDRPLQVVLKERDVDFHYENRIGNIENAGTERQKEEIVKQYKEKDKKRSFKLREETLMRVAVLQLAEEEYELVWSFHHILMDGWCIGILNREFFEIYNSNKENRPPQLPPVKPYKTYIQWLEERDKDASGKYWQQYLDTYEEIAAIPKIETAEDAAEYKNETVSIKLDQTTTVQLKKVAEKNHVTLNTLTQTLWGILLSRYSGKQDVVFGSVVSGRPPQIDGAESMVGLFINTVPVRIGYTEDTRFNSLLQKIQEEAIESQNHHYTPLAEIQSRSTQKKNLIDHIYIFENYPEIERIEGYESKSKNAPQLEVAGREVFEQTNYDLNVIIASDRQLQLKLDYNGNAYDREYMETLAVHFTRLAAGVIENDEMEISRYRMQSEEEISRILDDFNTTEAEYPMDKTIHGIFEEHAAKQPDRIAVQEDDRAAHYTYRQINEKANQIARQLRANGVKPDTFVAIMLEKSVEIVIGILGILKAGGAYLPLDPTYPEDRLRFMLKDSGVSILLTRETLSQALDLPVTRNIYFDRDREAIDREDTSNQPNVVTPANLAYIIYTSGTTGHPKGAMLEHRSVANLKTWQARAFNITAASHIQQCFSYSFDGAVGETFMALLNGAKLIMVDLKQLGAGRYMDFINTRRINLGVYVPSMLKQLEPTKLATRKDELTVVSVGEACTPDLVSQWAGKCIFVNGYGPTETTVYSHIWIADADEMENRRTAPIGMPISNYKSYVLDEHQETVPVGVAGELYITGAGVARGYLNRKEITDERFVPNRYYLQDKHEDRGEIIQESAKKALEQFRNKHSDSKSRRAETNGIGIANTTPEKILEMCEGLDDDLLEATRDMIDRYGDDPILYYGFCRYFYEAVENRYSSCGMNRDQVQDILAVEKFDGLKGIDFGFGNAETMQALAEAGAQIKGFDISPFFVRHARDRGLEAYMMRGDIEPDEFERESGIEKESQDFVLSTLVLDRAEKPRNLITNMLKTLKNGGKFAIQTLLPIQPLDDGEVRKPILYTALEDQITPGKNVEEDKRFLVALLYELGGREIKISRFPFTVSSNDGIQDYTAWSFAGTKTTGETPGSAADTRNKMYLKMYKTGDRVRYLPDGNLDFLGRIDHQVKIRGFRIELKEVENSLLKIEGIKEAVVIAHENRTGNKTLCAYIVKSAEKEQAPGSAELKEALARNLPEYMIPTNFIPLDAIPLTPNLKIDRKALPKPEAVVMSNEYTAPGDETEEKLTHIWADLLGLEQEKISIHHDFFELGGNSISLIKKLSRIYKEFGVEVEIMKLYNESTIRETARNIRLAQTAEIPVTLLNKERKEKIFCFPPAVSYGIAFNELAARMEDESLYGVNFIEEEDRIEKYVETITGIQPAGPYKLLGWSAAGKLIFQVAKALEEKGYDVSGIIFLDCFFDNKKTEYKNMDAWIENIEKSLVELNADFLKEKVRTKITKYSDYNLKTKNLDPVNAPVYQILSEEAVESKTVDPKCWDIFTTKGTTVYRGFGKHDQMLSTGAVEKNTAIIRKILEEINR